MIDDTTNHTITAKFTVSGDINLDGNVNFDDLLALAQSYGQTNKAYAQGDLDDAGTVDSSDLLILAQNYGRHLTVADRLTATAPEKTATPVSRRHSVVELV